jgi:hypothetical protein
MAEITVLISKKGIYFKRLEKIDTIHVADEHSDER